MVKHDHRMSPVAAGITGLIVGIVSTAALAMSDKQTRTRVTKKAGDMKDSLEKWSKDTLHDLQTTGEEVRRRSVERAAEKAKDLESRTAANDTLREKPANEERDDNKKVL